MSIYETIMDIIKTYIYGGNVATGSYEELVAIILATTACVAIIAIPFVIVKNVIDFISR